MSNSPSQARLDFRDPIMVSLEFGLVEEDKGPVLDESLPTSINKTVRPFWTYLYQCFWNYSESGCQLTPSRQEGVEPWHRPSACPINPTVRRGVFLSQTGHAYHGSPAPNFYCCYSAFTIRHSDCHPSVFRQVCIRASTTLHSSVVFPHSYTHNCSNMRVSR